MAIRFKRFESSESSSSSSGEEEFSSSRSYNEDTLLDPLEAYKELALMAARKGPLGKNANYCTTQMTWIVSNYNALVSSSFSNSKRAREDFVSHISVYLSVQAYYYNVSTNMLIPGCVISLLARDYQMSYRLGLGPAESVYDKEAIIAAAEMRYDEGEIEGIVERTSQQILLSTFCRAVRPLSELGGLARLLPRTYRNSLTRILAHDDMKDRESIVRPLLVDDLTQGKVNVNRIKRKLEDLYNSGSIKSDVTMGRALSAFSSLTPHVDVFPIGMSLEVFWSAMGQPIMATSKLPSGSHVLSSVYVYPKKMEVPQLKRDLYRFSVERGVVLIDLHAVPSDRKMKSTDKKTVDQLGLSYALISYLLSKGITVHVMFTVSNLKFSSSISAIRAKGTPISLNFMEGIFVQQVSKTGKRSFFSKSYRDSMAKKVIGFQMDTLTFHLNPSSTKQKEYDDLIDSVKRYSPQFDVPAVVRKKLSNRKDREDFSIYCEDSSCSSEDKQLEQFPSEGEVSSSSEEYFSNEEETEQEEDLKKKKKKRDVQEEQEVVEPDFSQYW